MFEEKKILNEVINDRAAVARILKISRSLMEQWCNPHNLSKSPLFRIMQIIEYAKEHNPEHADDILLFLAQETGFFVVPIPEGSDQLDIEAQKVLNKAINKHGNIFAFHDEICKAGKITRKEADKMAKLIWKLINVLLAYSSLIEGSVNE